MAINSGAINSFDINSSSYISILETLSETLGLNGSPSEVISYISFLDDTLEYLTDYSSKRDTNNTINEALLVLEAVGVILEATLTDEISYEDTVSTVLHTVESILENLLMSVSAINNQSSNSSILEEIEHIDSNSFGILKSIIESLAIIDSLGSKFQGNQEVVDNLSLSFSQVDSIELFSSISESCVLSDSAVTSAIIRDIIEDILYINVGLERDVEYLSYLLSPETFSVSTYTNYNFTGSCTYAGTPLFINSAGLYKYGGTLDISDSIVSSIQTAALSFGSSNLKQVPSVYLGLSNSNRVILKVAVDGKADILYNLTKKTEGLQTQKIAIGKGLIGRYFQFELITQESTQFELGSMEFLPITLKRKL